MKKPEGFPVGVYPIRRSNRFMASCGYKGKTIYVGSFDSIEEAKVAREAAVREFKRKSTQDKLESKNRGIFKVKSGFKTHIYIKAKKFYIGTYPTLEKAISERNKAMKAEVLDSTPDSDYLFHPPEVTKEFPKIDPFFPSLSTLWNQRSCNQDQMISS